MGAPTDLMPFFGWERPGRTTQTKSGGTINTHLSDQNVKFKQLKHKNIKILIITDRKNKLHYTDIWHKLPFRIIHRLYTG